MILAAYRQHKALQSRIEVLEGLIRDVPVIIHNLEAARRNGEDNAIEYHQRMVEWLKRKDAAFPSHPQ